METEELDRDQEDERKPAARQSVPDFVHDANEKASLDPSVYDVDFKLHPRSGVLKYVRPPVRRTIPQFDPDSFTFIYPDQSGSTMKASAKIIGQKAKKNSTKKLSSPAQLATSASRLSLKAQDDSGDPLNKTSKTQGRSTRQKSKPERLIEGYANSGSESNLSHASSEDSMDISSDGTGSSRIARGTRGVDRTQSSRSKKKKAKRKKRSSAVSGKAGSPLAGGPLATRVDVPHEHDVLMGRGHGITRHPGNVTFRDYCWQSREAYSGASRPDKIKVASKVLDKVLSQNPPARFLERVDHYWVEVDESKRVEKICQALREKKWFSVQQELLAKANQKRQTASQRWQEPSPPKKLATSVNMENPPLFKEKKKRAKSPPRPSKKTSSGAPSSAPSQGTLKVPPHPHYSPTVSTNTQTETSTVAYSKKNETPADRLPQATGVASKSKVSAKTKKEVTMGSRIKVYWPLDDTYYSAEVQDKIHDLYYLRYDDNETEWLDLTHHKYLVTSYGTGIVQGPVPGVESVPIAPRPDESE